MKNPQPKKVGAGYEPYGTFQRLLLLSALSFNELVGDGTAEIDKLYKQMFEGIKPDGAACGDVLKCREEAVIRLLEIYGFSSKFVRIVVSSGMIANNSLFKALFTIRKTSIFGTLYSGSNCPPLLKKMVKIARVNEKPQKTGLVGIKK